MQIVTAAALLALAPAVLAGSASVVNNCGKTVYYASVPANGNAFMAELPANGYTEAYGEDDIGISIKLAFATTGDVMQFEFTPSGNNINYDISDINGDPFTAGWSLNPSAGSSSDYPTCVPVNCAAGAGICTEAYNQPDDVRTNVCGISTNLVLTLCPGGSGSPAEPSSGSEPTASSAPAATNTWGSSPTTFHTAPTATGSVVYASTVYSTDVATAYTTVTAASPSPTGWNHNHARDAHAHRVHARHLPRK